jgi:hypothetical protein
MRLGQLARKVAVHPSEIVKFLAKKGVVIDEGTNTRITDSNTESIIREYAPHLIVPESSSERAVDDIQAPEANSTEIIPESEIEIPIAPVLEAPLAIEENEQSTVESNETTEIIKAAKIELKGLKVVGKIDLPDPKKKETTEEILTSEAELPAPKPTQRNPKRDVPKQYSGKPKKNPVALERERLEKEAEEKKIRKADEERERRKNFYAKRVKPSAPTKAFRIIDDPVSTIEEEPKEPPKGLLGRFLHWLTS